MKLVDGVWTCLVCGATLHDVPDYARVDIDYHAVNGDPLMRVIRWNGHEVHRCEAPRDAPGQRD